VSYPIFLYLENIKQDYLVARILIYVLFYPFLFTPLFPMIGNAIVGSVVMDLLMPFVLKKDKNLLRPLKYMTLFSFLLILMSIGVGSGPNTMPFFQSENEYVLSLLHLNPLLTRFTYVPIFLLKMHPLSIFYRIAIVSFIFCLAFYYFDVRTKLATYQLNRVSQYFMIFGNYSLSYFVYIPLFVLIVPIDFGPYLVWPAMLLAMLIMTWIFRMDLKYFYGAGLIEWLMMLFTVKWNKFIPMADYKMYIEKGVILPPKKK
jgi:hypothetical protein